VCKTGFADCNNAKSDGCELLIGSHGHCPCPGGNCAPDRHCPKGDHSCSRDSDHESGGKDGYGDENEGRPGKHHGDHGENNRWDDTKVNNIKIIIPPRDENITVIRDGRQVQTQPISVQCLMPTQESGTNSNLPQSEFTACAPQTFYADFDGDGLGDPAVSAAFCARPDGGAPMGYTSNNRDSCPSIRNIGVDANHDGIDDACNPGGGPSCSALFPDANKGGSPTDLLLWIWAFGGLLLISRRTKLQFRK
jgi:hypothetical protein